MKHETLYHLNLKDGNVNHFTGSISGLFDIVTSEQISTSLMSLYNHDWTKPFENDHCKIVKTFVYRKKHKNQ